MLIQLFIEKKDFFSRKSIPRVIFFSLLFLPGIVKAQTTIVTDSPFIKGTTVVIPGKEYKRSGYHNFFFGSHYRKEWATPIRVNNFYIDTAMGGLMPLQESGSRQSRGLRLKNSQGKEYVLRSVNKDFGNGLPEIYHGTFISHVAKDQASFGYPFAAITITPMIQAAGIYHTNPKIVFVPEQGELGDYNKKYGNQLYLFEERADENQEDAPHFGNSKNVIGSEKLYEHIYEDNDHRVDQKAFAKARLFDMFIGDWGRHADQWRWASFKDGSKTIYKPIPRDRDQAYSKINGLYPGLAASIPSFRFLQGFRYDIKNIKRFNTPGRPLDRAFTNELTEQQWIDLAKELQRSLTDQVIESAIHLVPPEYFRISGNTIIAKLKSRRDHLQEYAKDYYGYLSHHVDLVGSQQKELIEINRISPTETQINIFKVSKSNETKDKPYYSRTFKAGETKEVRLYGLEGSDIIKVTGSTNNGVKVRIIDPQAEDSLLLKKDHHTKTSVGKKFEFDTAHTKKFDLSIVPLMSPAAYNVFEKDPVELFTKTGIRISFNIAYNTQPWRKTQYENTHLVSANYGFLRGAFNVGYVGRLGHFIGSWDLLLKARYDAPAVMNYFGTGNETIYPDTVRNYNRTHTTRFYGGIGVSKDLAHHHAELTVFYQTLQLKKTPNKYISENFAVDPSLFNPRYFGGVEAGYNFTNTNSTITPSRGIDFNLAAAWLQNLQVNNRSFINLLSNLSVYLPISRQFTLAVRAGGATLSGKADFYHLNKLGGNVNLRGYDRERFYGKSSFYNNNELRWLTNTRNYLFNGKIGLLAFFDEGRVWNPGEISSKWHTGYGAGLILVPFNKIALTATYCTSTEGPFIQLKGSLFF
jgi:hypothetical protein